MIDEAAAADEHLSHADAAAIGLEGGQQFHECLLRLRAGFVALPDKPEETPLTTVRALWLTAAGQRVSAKSARSRPLPPLTQTQARALALSLDQRLQGVPLAHITQRQQFMGLDFFVGAEALIPRRETELLGEVALTLLPVPSPGKAPLMIDVCTGCGNLACALAMRRPDIHVLASDLSAEAIVLAQRNVDAWGLGERVTLHQGDLLQPFDRAGLLGGVDLLVCNPPYISSGRLESMPGEIIQHEPRLAFDGGPFGIRLVQRLIQEAPRFLRPGGWLAFEVGLGQAPATLRRLTPALGYTTVRPVVDGNCAPRVIVAQVSEPGRRG